jgi:hypothetical protein
MIIEHAERMTAAAGGERVMPFGDVRAPGAVTSLAVGAEVGPAGRVAVACRVVAFDLSGDVAPEGVMVSDLHGNAGRLVRVHRDANGEPLAVAAGHERCAAQNDGRA